MGKNEKILYLDILKIVALLTMMMVHISALFFNYFPVEKRGGGKYVIFMIVYQEYAFPFL